MQDLRVLRRGDAGYEDARRAVAWSARLPDRFPDAIAQASRAQDVVAAVRLAAREGWRIGVRSGGHSWSVHHLRDGGLLLDVSRLDEVSIDAAAMQAVVGPGRSGYELGKALARQGLFFPTGHCRGVALGGYLLQGGFGWNSRALGPACCSVEALDLVTADGELVRASANENADLYWAARGAGPGFFGVVVRFHLRLHPQPRWSGLAVQSFRMAQLEEVFAWAHAVGPTVPREVELQLMVNHHSFPFGGDGIDVVAPVFADRWADVRRALDFFQGSPVRRKARVATPFLPVSASFMTRRVMAHYPPRHRWGVDNLWTHAPFAELLPGLRRIVETMPPRPSHMLWLNWAPPPRRPDMAFSSEDAIYIACYGGWRLPEDDARYGSWATDRMRKMEPLSSGCQLADENLGEHPQRFLADEHLRRLDDIRAVRDPAVRFHDYLGRPPNHPPPSPADRPGSRP